MIGGSIRSMAGDTIGSSRGLMIEAGWSPGGGRMARRAFPIKVVDRLVIRMATGTTPPRNQRMVKLDILPGYRGVAAGAVALKMLGRFFIQMAGDTSR